MAQKYRFNTLICLVLVRRFYFAQIIPAKYLFSPVVFELFLDKKSVKLEAIGHLLTRAIHRLTLKSHQRWFHQWMCFNAFQIDANWWVKNIRNCYGSVYSWFWSLVHTNVLTEFCISMDSKFQNSKFHGMSCHTVCSNVLICNLVNLRF